MKKIRVLFITDGLSGGGKERQLVEILKFFDKKKYEIAVLTFNRNQHYTETVKKITNYYYLRKRPTRLEPLFSIWRVFLEFKPDIIHTWDSLSSFYSYLPTRYYRAKLIDGSIRDSGIEKGWQYHFKRFFLKRADLVVSNSKIGLSTYRVNGKVIYNAINTDRFLPIENNNEFNIIKVANFTDYKDHETYIKAAIKLVKLKIVDNVYLAGSGTHEKKHVDFINNHSENISSKFHFLGSINNVEKYLSKCKVGVLCSTKKFSEGISNSVLEYMAAGLVPIVTDIGGSSEIIDNGKNGFLIKHGGVNEIIDRIKIIKENPSVQKNLSYSAKQTIKSKFNYKKNIKLLLKEYQELL